MSNVWETLSAIDVGAHVEKKGQLSYLSWAWAWGVLMKHYPASNYSFLNPIRNEDGTVMVECDLTIEDITRRMWLPVMDHRNKAIQNPNMRQISDTQMRCLVKAIAMFGLGHYIYAGEDLPDPDAVHNALTSNYQEIVSEILAGIEADDDLKIIENWQPLSEQEKSDIWKAKTKGGFFSQHDKDRIRSALASLKEGEK